jgi:uncharacterized membrane protein YphA (DoxX/SURF4 family)
MLSWLFRPRTDAPPPVILIRIMAGSVFLWEGIMKLVFTNLGEGRFTKLGFPAPGALATFVALVEIIGGVCLIAGLLTRFWAIAFVIEMVVAMLSTKIGLYLGTSPLAPPAAPPKIGLWAVLHEIRSEWAQLLSVTFLLLVGPGRLSIDRLLARYDG